MLTSATHAEIGEDQELRLEALGFRIAAPGAVQRAAFEEDRGAQARPVFRGYSLDIVNNALHAHKARSLPDLIEIGRASCRERV